MPAIALLWEHQTSTVLQKYVKNAPESRQRSHVGLDEEPKCTKNSWHCCLFPACLGNRALGSLVGFYNRRNQHHPRFQATIILPTVGCTTSEHHHCQRIPGPPLPPPLTPPPASNAMLSRSSTVLALPTTGFSRAGFYRGSVF